MREGSLMAENITDFILFLIVNRYLENNDTEDVIFEFFLFLEKSYYFRLDLYFI